MFDKSANHSAPWKPRFKLDLQMFAGEEEDAMLPDDYVAPDAATPPAAPDPVTPVDPGSETPPSDLQPPADPPQQPPAAPSPTDATKIKVKYNHEEKELALDEAVPLIQKGMNYDKLQEKLTSLENDPGRQLLERLAASNNMTVPDYLEAVRQAEEQQQLSELVQKNIPPELAQEILEGRKDRAERANEKTAKAEQAKRDAELTDFISHFQQENSRPFDPDKDTIPKEVWEANAQGTPLKFAYMDYQNKQLKTQLKVAKQNEENLKKAPVGSVTAHGGTEVGAKDDFERGFDSVE